MQEKGSELTVALNTHVVILGAGFIGLSFSAAFADSGWRVTLADPDSQRRAAAAAGIEVQRQAIQLAGLGQQKDGDIIVVGSPDSALGTADLVLECGPEVLEIKQAIFVDLLAKTGENTILTTASSAIPMSRIVPEVRDQTRCLVAHPMNPPAVLRIIELCPAPGTAPGSMERAAAMFSGAGFATALLGHEIEGFILNRLQGAVLREAYRLVNEGVAEPNDIDKAMRLGLGPRWALAGPFETAELNTPGGITAHAERMGPAYRRMGEARGETVDWSDPLISRVSDAREVARSGATIAERAQWRSRAVARLVALRDELLGNANA